MLFFCGCIGIGNNIIVSSKYIIREQLPHLFSLMAKMCVKIMHFSAKSLMDFDFLTKRQHCQNLREVPQSIEVSWHKTSGSRSPSSTLDVQLLISWVLLNARLSHQKSLPSFERSPIKPAMYAFFSFSAFLPTTAGLFSAFSSRSASRTDFWLSSIESALFEYRRSNIYREHAQRPIWDT